MQKTSNQCAVNNKIKYMLVGSLFILLIVIFPIFVHLLLFTRTNNESSHYNNLVKWFETHTTDDVRWRQSTECCQGLRPYLNLVFAPHTPVFAGGPLQPQSGFSGKLVVSASAIFESTINDKTSLFNHFRIFYLESFVRENILQLPQAGRSWIEHRFSMLLPQPYQTILQGMVLGDGGFLSKTIQHSIKTMGIQHIFSVSGANFSVLALMLTLPLKKLSLRSQVWLTAPVCVVYAALVGVQYPVLRACSMFLYNRVASGLLQVQAKPLYGLAVWIAVVLVVAPDSVVSVSFQLTIAATLGILVAHQPVLRLSARLLEEKTRLFSVLQPLFLGVAVYIGVGPVLAWQFHEVGIASIFYTALLYWMIELASFGGFVVLGYICISSVVLSASMQGLSDPLISVIASWTAAPLLAAVRLAVDAPALVWRVTPGIWLLLLLMVVLFCRARLVSLWLVRARTQLSVKMVRKHHESCLFAY